MIERLGLDWQSRTCWLDVLAFFEPGSDARAARIEWWGVRDLRVPFGEPWGLGGHTSINAQRKEDAATFVIELQSGDDIRVVAASTMLIETSHAHPRDR